MVTSVCNAILLGTGNVTKDFVTRVQHLTYQPVHAKVRDIVNAGGDTVVELLRKTCRNQNHVQSGIKIIVDFIHFKFSFQECFNSKTLFDYLCAISP